MRTGVCARPPRSAACTTALSLRSPPTFWVSISICPTRRNNKRSVCLLRHGEQAQKKPFFIFYAHQEEEDRAWQHTRNDSTPSSLPFTAKEPSCPWTCSCVSAIRKMRSSKG